MILKQLLSLALGLTLGMGALWAQETPKPSGLSEDELKKANDPMANTKALNINNYIVSSMYGLPDASANQLIFRYAQPFGKVLVRASMPIVVSAPAGDSPTSGLGDFNAFAIYSKTTSTGNKFGVGPSITIPTATDDALNAGKWQIGISALAFIAKSHQMQWGSLLQWQTSFAGDDDRPDVSLLIPQIFAIWQIGGGTYLRSTGIWSFNLENGDYNVPIGLGIGKIAEPQFTVLAEGVGQPKFQTFVGFNTQF